jgi:hypothetical protein
LKRFVLLFLLPLFILASCSFFNKKNERVLARVSDDYLYESDIRGVVPHGTAPKDSMSLVRNFINTWIRQRLLIHQAEKNLTGDQMDFSKQLEDYKNSLVIYSYEKALVEQKLDTVVTDDEISLYYDSNQKNFLLKDNIVQMQYVKLALRSPDISQFRKLLNSDDATDKTILANKCEKLAADYFLDDQNWLPFSDVLRQIPIKTYNEEEFLKNRRNFEYQDSLYTYLVRIRDFRIKETVSPLAMEKDRIRNIILNKRKIDLINKMHEDVFQEAQRKNEFEIY